MTLKPTKEELAEILAAHKKWARGETGGKRADLSDANLRVTDLRGADLRSAYMSGADMRKAYLRSADLSDANLRVTDLRGADLRSAYMSGADMSAADLRDCNLSGADLSGANLSAARLPPFQIPQEGELTVWKKLRCEVLAKLLIPAEARRTATPIGRKCRAEFARVLAMTDGETSGSSGHGTVYTVGEIVRPDKFDDDIRLECTNGIHFFLTREEAEEY